MPTLFGVDIQREIADAFRGQLHTGVLEKLTPGTRTTGSLTAGTNPTTESHAFDGFVEIKQVRIKGDINAQARAVLTVIAGSLPAGIEPAMNDHATIESLRYLIAEILERDPASAVFECLVQ